MAKELGIVEQTLGNWVRQERIDRGERQGTTSTDRAEITRLQRENKQLRLERDLLKLWGNPDYVEMVTEALCLTEIEQKFST